jgi:hypothetical protein
MPQPDPNARQAQSVKQALVRCPTCREVTRLCRCWIPPGAPQNGAGERTGYKIVHRADCTYPQTSCWCAAQEER